MKKYFTILAIIFCGVASRAQVLHVSLVTQEQDQWCWAGCTKCILNYYGNTISQCTIADYTRTVATWHSYGTTNCCTDATVGCNYWNYNWGFAGSIQDILTHFGSIANTGVNNALSTTTIASVLGANHLFVEHWAWTTGGGHFVVGYGINGTGSGASIYYMNPWPGEGLLIGSYTFMESGVNDMGDHTWDATNEITSYPHTAGIEPVTQIPVDEKVYPNPSTGQVWINARAGSAVEVYNTTGSLVYSGRVTGSPSAVDLSVLAKGLYIVKIGSAEGNSFAKVVME